MDAKMLFNIKCIIIEEVKDRPMIYDKANKDYSQTIKCMRCFDKIAAVINRDDVDGEFYFLLLSWPENQGILFFYISKTLQMNRISFMASLLNAVL